MCKIRTAFVGFGEVNSPRELIEKKCEEAKEQLLFEGIEVIYTAPVSDDPEGNDIKRAVSDLKGKEFDSLVVCIAGWIPSHAVISIISKFKHIPMVLWGLTGYYDNGRLVTTADQAGTTALRKVMEDMGYIFKYVYNMPGVKSQVHKVTSYLKAAASKKLLLRAKVVTMGYRDMNLYGTMFDGVSLRSRIGVEIETFEMLEMVQKAEKFTEEEVSQVIEKIKKDWNFQKQPDEKLLETGSRYYLAIKDKILERGYEATSLIDVDGMKKLLNFPPSMIFMLLADDPGVCTIPENDTLGAVTQLMVKYLTGQIGAYVEFYEFMEDRVLVGVPDYVPFEIVDGKVEVCPSSFGEFGESILNVSKLKTGKITLCRLASSGDKYRMHIVTGEAVQPGEWEEAGWAPPAPQLPSLEVILDTSVNDFAQKVMSQHYIITYGDNIEIIKELCTMIDVEIV